MVERIHRDPRSAPITEAEVRVAPPPRRGLCLFCGTWLEPDEDSFLVALTSPGDERSDHVACPACIQRVAHASARLAPAPAPGTDAPTIADPVPPAAAQPDNYLAGKYRTPSGR
jgi:hypothetical protein